jgi:pSer/pThr/pTyr-binding forkhead associated (FHA) protein
MGGRREPLAFAEPPPAFAEPPPAVLSPPTPPPAPIVERSQLEPDYDEPEATLAPPSVSGMRKCPNCSTPNPTAFKFCGACGARLDVAQEPIAQPPAVAPPTEGAEGYLVLIRPDGSEGGSFALSSGSNPAGREVDPLFAADAYLSPMHASFDLSGGRLIVHDEGSLNGIFVRVLAEKPIEISSGDVVRLGQELVRIEVLPGEMADDDGTELMGSISTEEIWGRVSLIVGKDQMADAYCLNDEGVVLGRERGDVLFPEDGYVSGTHLRIQRQGDRIIVTDLNSSNGTFLRVNQEQELHRGDYILMGQQLFRVDF